MPIEPAWWYRPEPTPVARLLQPLAHIWSRVAERRMQRAAPYKSKCPVICIGNFTAGGTGKTPMTRVVVSELRALGCEPVILTRGYGGRIAGPHLVDPGSDTSIDVGDEALLHASSSPVMVARDRAKGAAAIEAMPEAGDKRRVIVMDDGLQNPSVAKDLSFAVVDGRRGLGNGLVMPAGPLRAPIERQLARVDAIVINRPMGPEMDQDKSPVGTSSPIAGWLQQHFERRLLHATTVPSGDTAWLRQKPVLAYAGIGAPERFFRLLQALGASIVDAQAFSDHHVFKEADARHLMCRAQGAGAVLVTTEKDWVRLGGCGPQCEALKRLSCTLPIELRFDADAHAELKALLLRTLAPDH